MEQTVYGDILFFVNFCMDFQCLFLTAKLLHRPFPLWRSLLASALGALYACVALFLSVSGVFALVADCGVCLLMCVCVFWSAHSSAFSLLLPFAVYFGTSAAVGGVMSGMAALLSHVDVPIGGGGAELSSGAFFLLALLGGAATFLWGRVCQRRAKGRRALLELTFDGEQGSFHCMVDTANLLRDPVGGRPVALIDATAAEAVLPKSLLETASGGCGGIAALPVELARRIRLIPANTATGQGTLLAIAPDTAFLDAGQGRVPVELLVAPVSLSLEAEDCTVLLPAELIAQ